MTYSVRCPACYSSDATYDPRDRVIECQSGQCQQMRWKFNNSAALLFDAEIQRLETEGIVHYRYGNPVLSVRYGL